MRIEGCKNLFVVYVISKKYVIHIRALKEAIDHGLVLQEVYRVIEFN